MSMSILILVLSCLSHFSKSSFLKKTVAGDRNHKNTDCKIKYNQ